MVGFVRELSEDLVPLVNAFLHIDPIANAYAIYDLHYLRHRTRFYVYVEGNAVKGLLIDYVDPWGSHFIWLLGDGEAAEGLLTTRLPDRMVFITSPELADIVKRRFPITAEYPMDFMILRRGGEKLYLRHEVRKLSPHDAYSFASLRSEKPGERDVEVARILLEEEPWFGIYAGPELVSVASIHAKIPEIWMIGGFYTKPEYRNRGYATSLASFLVREALKETNYVGLLVREDNYPAKRVYEKVGFKTFKKIYWLDHNTGLAP